MKYAAQFLLVAGLLTLPVFARSGGGGHGGGGGFHGSVGGGFHGMTGGVRGGYGGGIGRVGGYGRGGYGYSGRNRYNFSLRYYPGFYGYPYYGYWGYGLGDWSYPYYDSGYDSSYYDPGYANQGYDYGYQPPVVIYQTPPAPQPPVHSEIREYPQGPATSTIRPAGEPPIYLIAIKGQDNILAGITYWVEGDTLQYINLQHVQKHVALSSVDRALTARLNQERNMDLRLPPA